MEALRLPRAVGSAAEHSCLSQPQGAGGAPWKAWACLRGRAVFTHRLLWLLKIMDPLYGWGLLTHFCSPGANM